MYEAAGKDKFNIRFLEYRIDDYAEKRFIKEGLDVARFFDGNYNYIRLSWEKEN